LPQKHCHGSERVSALGHVGEGEERENMDHVFSNIDLHIDAFSVKLIRESQHLVM
jgi:hypothetical protein